MAELDKQLYEDIGAIKQHLKDLNGNLPTIRKSLASIDTRVDGLESDFAAWKARMTLASSLFGAITAGVVLAIKYVFFGKSD